jgi:hypothetical protein
VTLGSGTVLVIDIEKYAKTYASTSIYNIFWNEVIDLYHLHISAMQSSIHALIERVPFVSL